MSTSEPRPPNHGETSQKKRRKPKIAKPQPASTSLSRSQLRKKIRDITRLLNASAGSTFSSKNPNKDHPNNRASKLSATARAEHERALAAYTHELAAQQITSKRQALEKKYHKVRFFERRKATRQLERLNRLHKAAASDPERTELEGKIQAAEIDLNYILHYPGLEKYISLYKRTDIQETNQKRERIRTDIARRMKDGTLDHREAGPVDIGHEEPINSSSLTTKDLPQRSNQKNKGTKHRAKDGAHDERDEGGDNSSDGGFFEF